MNAPAAMQADYCDLRFVKGRKVIQVVLELPIEAGAQFVSMFGTPDPSKTVPVAIARLGGNGSAGGTGEGTADAPSEPSGPPVATPEKAKRKWDELSIAQQAGIMCNEKGFQTFVAEQLINAGSESFTVENMTAADAATFVRSVCGVNSRAHIEGKPEAERIFRDLRIAYDNWLRT